MKNMKKFEEGVFSDLRNLKPGIDACLEEPKVGYRSPVSSRVITMLIFFTHCRAHFWTSCSNTNASGHRKSKRFFIGMSSRPFRRKRKLTFFSFQVLSSP